MVKIPSRQDKTEERVQQRTTQILEAAARVFARKGFHKATTKEIAAEAGVAEGTIYNYYASKRDLLLAMVAKLASENLSETFEQAGEGDGDARTLLTAILHNRFDLFERNREILPVVLYELIADADFRRRHLAEVVAPLVKDVTLHLSKHIVGGTFRSFNPRIILPAFVGATVMSALMSMTELGTPIFSTSPLSREEVIDELVEFFLHGVARDEKPKRVEKLVID